MIVLERDDDRARVQPQDPGEIGALDAPGLTREAWLAASRSASRFRARSTSNLETISLLKLAIWLDQVVPPLDAVECPGELAAVLVNAKVGISGQEQGVVLGCLDVPLPGIEDPLRDQWLKVGIGHVHELK